MSQTVEKLRVKIFVDKYPLCTEKIRLLTESYKKTEGEPLIVRKAKAPDTDCPTKLVWGLIFSYRTSDIVKMTLDKKLHPEPYCYPILTSKAFVILTKQTGHL
jgi:hypothetical protein